MPIFADLSVLAVRQIVTAAATAASVPGASAVAGAAGDALRRHLADHSRQLTAALGRANARAWKALEFSLAGEGLWQRGKALLANGDDKAFRRHAQAFLDTVAAPQLPADPDFRPACLRELREARKAGVLTDGQLDPAELSRKIGVFAALTEGPAVLDAEWRVLDQVADQFPANRYPHLKQLLRLRAAGAPPLLAAAVRYFFRIEVQGNEALFRGLAFDTLGQIEQSQQQGFDALHELLDRHGSLLEQLLDLPAAILDLGEEQHRQGEILDEIYDAVAHLKSNSDLQTSRLRSRDVISVHTDPERQLFRSLLERFRALPPDQQKKAPALLNSVGMVAAAAAQAPDDPFLAIARQIFREVADVVPDDLSKAEAYHNEYLAALEQRNWTDGLAALRRCVACAPEQFSPFPFDRYEPLAILGAGAFGTAFLCRHPWLKTQLVVKALNPSELQRDVDDLFREAQVLEELNHPGIIRVREAGFAGAHHARPFLVMDYFDGTDLDEHVKQRGVLSLEAGLSFASQLAEAVAAAHAKGLLHRDLKPSNVLVKVDGPAVRMKLIDFGLALRSSTLRGLGATVASGRTLVGSSIAGSADYSAPEQMGKLTGVSVGPYSDVYGWAKTVCWALCKTAQPLPRHFRPMPPALAELLEDCMAEEPKDRPAGFAAVLERLRGGGSAVPAPVVAPKSAPKPAAPAPPPLPPPPPREITNSVGMKLVRVELGKFLMGSPASEAERDDNETQHEVRLTKAFHMAATPVTQAQWKAVMGANPSQFKGDTLPVEQVSWKDAVEFCKKLSQKESKNYRLPTEAEWEYACRAGSTTPFYTGETISTDQANYDGNYTYGAGRKGVYRKQTTPVGSFKPNAWGLYDMHGNVWEWCGDAYAPYGAGSETDPTGPPAMPQDASRVLRGGSWDFKPWGCRSACRNWFAPDSRLGLIGFRVVLDSR